MPRPSQPLPTVGGLNSSEDPKIRSVLQELQSILSGNVDLTNLVSGLVPNRKLVTDLAGVSSYTFGGLDGNIDRQYRLGYSGVVAGLAGSDRAISLRPNDPVTSFFDSVAHQTWWDAGMQTSAFEYRGTNFGWLIGQAYAFAGGSNYGANHVVGEAIVEAKIRSGTPRVAKSSWSSSPDAATERHLIAYAGGKWEDETNDITSLKVNFGGGTFTGDLWLERVFAP